MNNVIFILVSVFFLLIDPAYATCYKITAMTSDPNSPYYTETGKGTASNWDGAIDSSGSIGTLPIVANINNSTFQPDGTMITSGIVSFIDSGAQKYSAEQILFRCSPDESGRLYEYYATNGDSEWAGKVNVGASAGLPETYRTYADGMALRATNLDTGEYYSRYWKARLLSSLDTDSKGWILVKAKNFSNTKIELFRLSNSTGPKTDTGIYPDAQPGTYIAFQGGGISPGLSVGADSLTQYSGWYTFWPGAVNFYNRLYIRRSATCSVTNVTPTVFFPTISVAALNSGIVRQMPITIQFQCQTGSPANTGVSSFSSGTSTNQTALGFLVGVENANSAVQEGFSTSGGGIQYLLSNGYGKDTSVATGVGVQISRTNGAVLNLLSTLSGPILGGNLSGWYPILDDANQGSVTSGVTSYSKIINATFKALPGKTVTPGKYNSSLQVIIQVQ